MILSIPSILLIGLGAITFLVGFMLAWLIVSKRLKEICNEKNNSERKFLSELSFRKSLQIEVEALKEKEYNYLRFFVSIPEAIKRLSSTLTVDEVTSSTVRLTYTLIPAFEICLFLFDSKKEILKPALSYGLDKEKIKNISFALGEGKIGIAGEAKVVLESRDFLDNPIFSPRTARGPDPFSIDLCAPIRFKEILFGVICVGKIKVSDQNHRTFLAMVSDLAAISLKNAKSFEDAQLIARIDPLTKIYNRRHFQERIFEEMQKCINYNFECSVFIFDVDHFKVYNDQNGHQAGDKLLQQIAILVKENTRGSDIFARYGGEEFIVLLSNTGREKVHMYGQNICKLIASADFPFKEKQPLGIISVSGGVASFPKDGSSLEEVIKKADEGLYLAKNSGRNRVCHFSN